MHGNRGRKCVLRGSGKKYLLVIDHSIIVVYTSLRPDPVTEVLIPHNHRLESEGQHIPVYHMLPSNASKSSPVPCVIIFTGLDGYRTELAVWMEGWRQVGLATIVLEIPGTGDCPATPSDPLSPDRLYSSLFDWVEQQDGIDSKKVCIWAFSTGGYYAIRVAHTHPDKLAGVVALGGGCHHMFDPEWLSEVNHLEYPFDLANTLAYKFGYGNDVEKFKKEASDKFSLLKDGTLDKPRCARLLLVNVSSVSVSPYALVIFRFPADNRFRVHKTKSFPLMTTISPFNMAPLRKRDSSPIRSIWVNQ